MNRVFISYSGSRIDRAELFYALRDHGLNPWRDVESLYIGDNTTDEIHHTLEQSTMAMLWINEDILNSTYVARVELPAITRVWSRNGLRVVPVFDGMAPSQASERMRALGIEIHDSYGHIVDPHQPPAATAREIAARCARAHIDNARASNTPPIVRLVSYDDTADLRDDAVLNLDWRHRLTNDSLTAAAEEQLRSALRSSTAAMKEAYGAREITLAVKAHLPLAVAIGHAFAQPTGCTLRMPRDGQDWNTISSTADATPLAELPALRGPVEATTASLEISVSRNVEAGVDAYVNDGHHYLHRVKLTTQTGAGRGTLDGPQTGNAWARQIGNTITDLTDRPTRHQPRGRVPGHARRTRRHDRLVQQRRRQHQPHELDGQERAIQTHVDIALGQDSTCPTSQPVRNKMCRTRFTSRTSPATGTRPPPCAHDATTAPSRQQCCWYQLRS